MKATMFYSILLAALVVCGINGCGNDEEEVLFEYVIDVPVELPFNGDVFLTQVVDIGNIPNAFNQRLDALGFTREDVARIRVSRARLDLVEGEQDLFFMRSVNMGLFPLGSQVDTEIAFRELDNINGGNSIELFPSLPDVTEQLAQNFINLRLEYAVRAINVATRVRVVIEVEAVRRLM